MYLQNNQPKIITYRDYENFDNSHFSEDLLSDRSSRLQVFCRKGIFSNFNFIKKETLTQVFSCEFYKISKNTIFIEYNQATASKKPILVVATYQMHDHN